MSLHPTAQSRLFRIQSLTFAVDELDVRQNNHLTRQSEITNKAHEITTTNQVRSLPVRQAFRTNTENHQDRRG